MLFVSIQPDPVCIYLTPFINTGCEANDSQKSKLNHCTSQEPHGEKTRNKVSAYMWEEKKHKNYFIENPQKEF